MLRWPGLFLCELEAPSWLHCRPGGGMKDGNGEGNIPEHLLGVGPGVRVPPTPLLKLLKL